jgi:hypothetical protein
MMSLFEQEQVAVEVTQIAVWFELTVWIEVNVGINS